MVFGGFDRGGATAPMAEINMIPLIDVMLVLLVIFIVTAPLLTHAVKVDLPRASSAPNVAKPGSVQLAIDNTGAVYWDGKVLDRAGWRSHMEVAATHLPQPELHIRADGAVAYRRVAEVMADAAQAGLTRVGFLTNPRDERYE